jgi:hypothetical protein
MHISNHQPESHRRMQRLDILPSVGRCWSVKKHQKDSGDRQQNEKKET